MDQDNQQTQEEILETQKRELEQIDDENKTRKDIDTIYDEIGFGKYQILATVLFGIFFMLFAIQILTPTLFFQDPTFLCNGVVCKQDQYCDTNPNDRSIDEKSSIYSITKAFQLYCGSGKTKKSVGESMEFIGSMFSLIIIMWIGDNWGRRIANAISLLICVIGSICIVAFNNLVMIYIGLFLVGGGVQAAAFTQLVLLNEMSTGHNRSVIVCMMYVTFGLAELFIWPQSLITTDYRWFNLYFLLIPYVLCLSFPFFVHESPKFYQQKNIIKCVETINKIARMNGSLTYYTEQDIQLIDKSNQKDYNYYHLFKYASTRKTTVCMIGLSIGIHALYYGMQFSLDLIGSDFAKNTFYVGIADFLGYGLSDFICPKFPRKKWLILTLTLSSLFCFSFAIDQVPDDCVDDGESCIQKTMQIIQAMLSRFIISFSFSFMIIWMQELFPTSVRSLGVGFVAAMGLMGAEVTPFIKQADEDYYVIILGVFGVLGAAAVFFLRETFEQPLLEEIPELTRRYSIHHSHGDKIEDDDKSSISEIIQEQRAKQGLMKSHYESINSSIKENNTNSMKQKLLD